MGNVYIEINSQNIIVNTDHIVAMHFTPAAKGYDEEEQRDYDNPAQLAIVTDGLKLEQCLDYEGVITGAAATSIIYQVRGAEAEQLWTAIKNRRVSV